MKTKAQLIQGLRKKSEVEGNQSKLVRIQAYLANGPAENWTQNFKKMTPNFPWVNNIQSLGIGAVYLYCPLEVKKTVLPSPTDP